MSKLYRGDIMFYLGAIVFVALLHLMWEIDKAILSVVLVHCVPNIIALTIRLKAESSEWREVLIIPLVGCAIVYTTLSLSAGMVFYMTPSQSDVGVGGQIIICTLYVWLFAQPAKKFWWYAFDLNHKIKSGFFASAQ